MTDPKSEFRRLKREGMEAEAAAREEAARDAAASERLAGETAGRLKAVFDGETLQDGRPVAVRVETEPGHLPKVVLLAGGRDKLLSVRCDATHDISDEDEYGERGTFNVEWHDEGHAFNDYDGMQAFVIEQVAGIT